MTEQDAKRTGASPRTRSWVALFARFTAAGAAGTAAHYAMLVALVESMRTPPSLAAGVGALLGAAVNYALNYHVTFRSRAGHSATLPKFALVALAGALLNYVVVYISVRLGLHYLVGQVLATGLVLCCGFLANHWWTFSTNRDERIRPP